MEVSIFTQPEVSRLLEKFVELRLHVDDKDPARRDRFTSYQKELVNNTAIPFYVIVEPDDLKRARAVFAGADLPPPGARFRKFLEAYLARS